jgi:hypothetical protein
VVLPRLIINEHDENGDHADHVKNCANGKQLDSLLNKFKEEHASKFGRLDYSGCRRANETD